MDAVCRCPACQKTLKEMADNARSVVHPGVIIYGPAPLPQTDEEKLLMTGNHSMVFDDGCDDERYTDDVYFHGVREVI